MRAIRLLSCLSLLVCRCLFAEESVEAVESAPAAPAPQASFVVVLPERIDDVWYWLQYSEQSQHLTQTAVEKELVKAGLNILDAATLQGVLQDGTSLEALTGTQVALAAARKSGATYLITGQATAAKASQGSAYGVTIIRSNAEATAKIVRVSDAKVLSVHEASALEGGEASRGAGQQAIKKAAKSLAKDVAAAAKALPGAAPAP
jgi:hypothetical protein